MEMTLGKFYDMSSLSQNMEVWMAVSARLEHPST